MEHRTFGDSDLSCSVLGFGTWELSTTQYGEIDVDDAARAVNAAIDREEDRRSVRPAGTAVPWPRLLAVAAALGEPVAVSRDAGEHLAVYRVANPAGLEDAVAAWAALGEDAVTGW